MSLEGRNNDGHSMYYVLFRLCPRLNCPHPANIVTLYVNLSLWAWATFLVLVFTTCSIGNYSPGSFLIMLTLADLYQLWKQQKSIFL